MITVTREMILAFQLAYDRCNLDPDDDHSPVMRGLEAIVPMIPDANYSIGYNEGFDAGYEAAGK